MALVLETATARTVQVRRVGSGLAPLGTFRPALSLARGGAVPAPVAAAPAGTGLAVAASDEGGARVLLSTFETCF